MSFVPCCRTYPRERLSQVHKFIKEHPHILLRLPRGRHDTYLKICSSISHLRSRKSIDFFLQTLNNMEALVKSPNLDLILSGASMLSAHNWTLVGPYLSAVKAIPQKEDIIERWSLFVCYLADRDIGRYSYRQPRIHLIATLRKRVEAAIDSVHSRMLLWFASSGRC